MLKLNNLSQMWKFKILHLNNLTKITASILHKNCRFGWILTKQEHTETTEYIDSFKPHHFSGYTKKLFACHLAVIWDIVNETRITVTSRLLIIVIKSSN